jgi:hypothetical protein
MYTKVPKVFLRHTQFNIIFSRTAISNKSNLLFATINLFLHSHIYRLFVHVSLCCVVLCRYRPCDGLITRPRSPTICRNRLRQVCPTSNSGRDTLLRIYELGGLNYYDQKTQFISAFFKMWYAYNWWYMKNF